MLLCIGSILKPDELANVCEQIDRLDFGDGRKTAGWAARLVKKNTQAESSEELEQLRSFLTDCLTENELFQLAARPKEMTPIMISRYTGGEQYGTHVDDALMQGMRSDLSYTLFLADPQSYDGGELVIEQSAGEQTFKLEPGSMILYPSTTLHRVEPVTRGVRTVAFGWIRSFVRSAEHREILFDLETVRRRVFDEAGKTNTFDVLSKTTANLLRLWAED